MCVSSWAPWLPQGASTQLAPALFCRLNGELMIRQKAGFRSIATHQLAQDIQRHWYVVRKSEQGSQNPPPGTSYDIDSLSLPGSDYLWRSQKAFQSSQGHRLHQRWRVPHVGHGHQLGLRQDIDHAPGLCL
jgi:hypothetical protein